MIIQKLVVFLFLSFILSSCVSSKKYQEIVILKDHYKEKNEALKKVKQNYEDLQKEFTKTKDQISRGRQQLGNLSEQYVDLEKEKQLLEIKVEGLEQYSEELKTAAADQKADYETRLKEKEATIKKKEDEISWLKYGLSQYNSNPDSVLNTISSTEMDFLDLYTTFSQQKKAIESISADLKEALSDFSEKEILYRSEGGKFFISLLHDRLYSTTANTFNSRGKRALRKIATVLKTKGWIIQVQGNVDQQATNGDYWEKSTQAALSAAQSLISYGLAPQQVVPSGRGYYFPLAADDNPEASRLNERTEIILTPQIETVYRLMMKE